MTHFGIISPSAATGPLNTMLPLGQELAAFALRHTQAQSTQALAAGIEFQVIGEKDFLVGSTTESLTKLGQLRGLAALHHSSVKDLGCYTPRCSALMKAAG